MDQGIDAIAYKKLIVSTVDIPTITSLTCTSSVETIQGLSKHELSQENHMVYSLRIRSQ